MGVKGKEIYIKVTLQPWVLKIMVLLDLGPAPFILWLCWANQENFTQAVNIGLWYTQRVISYLDFAKKEGRGRILFGFLDLLQKHAERWQIFVGLT